MTKEQSKRAGGRYNLDDKGTSYQNKLKDDMETNEYMMCVDCQMTFLPEHLTNDRCVMCYDIIVLRDQEYVDTMTEAEKDEYSQCIACEAVVDNEFISEHGLCIECLRSDLRALESNIHPRTEFRFVFMPDRPTSKAIYSTLKKNEKLTGNIEIIINASNEGWAWSALLDLIVDNQQLNKNEWKLK